MYKWCISRFFLLFFYIDFWFLFRLFKSDISSKFKCTFFWDSINHLSEPLNNFDLNKMFFFAFDDLTYLLSVLSTMNGACDIRESLICPIQHCILFFFLSPLHASHFHKHYFIQCTALLTIVCVDWMRLKRFYLFIANPLHIIKIIIERKVYLSD